MKGEIIADGSDRTYGTDNTNGMNCTQAAHRKNYIKCVKPEISTRKWFEENLVDCVLYFVYAYCTICAVYSTHKHDKKESTGGFVFTVIAVLTALTARLTHILKKIGAAKIARTKHFIQSVGTVHSARIARLKRAVQTSKTT